jgi:hypothetical protein
MKQLDLFYRSSGGVVLPFPVERQRAVVRSLVRALEIRDDGKQTKFWRMTVNRMVGQMQVLGIDKATIDGEVRALHRAIRAEYVRQQIWGRPDDRQDGAG